MNNENPKILPLPNPLVTSSPHSDTLMSILLTKDFGETVIFENFINMFYINFENTFPWVDFAEVYLFTNLPGLTVYKYPYEYIKDNYEKIIKLNTDKDMYCIYSHDTYYCKAYSNFHNYHHRHELLIYGYDRDNFYCKDYFDYTFNTPKIIDISQALDSFNAFQNLPKIHKDHSYNTGVIFYKLCDNKNYSINLSRVYYLLNQLFIPFEFRSEKDYFPYPFEYFFDLPKIIESSTTPVPMRLVNFAASHSKLMYLRALHISKTYINFNNIAKEFDVVYTTYEKIAKMYIKYTNNLNSALKERIIALLIQNATNYELLVKKFIRFLSETIHI